MLTAEGMRPVELVVSVGGNTLRLFVFVSKDWTIDDIKKAYGAINPKAVIDVVNREIQLDLLVDNNV
jgi:hypothetical protein